MEQNLKEAVFNYILSLNLPPGGQIPTETKISHKFQLTRYRVRKIIDELSAEHDWTKIQGSGTYLPGGNKKNRPIERVIAVIVPFSRNLPVQMLEAHKIAMARDYRLLIFSISHDKPEYEMECLHHLLSRRVFALIIDPHPGNPDNFTLIDQLIADGCRVILLNAPPDKKSSYRVFDFNYRKAGYMAVAHLLRQGIDSLVHIGKWNSVAWQHQGFRDGVREAADDFNIPLEYHKAILNLNIHHFGWHWLPDDFQLPLHENCGYICDSNVLDASYCYSQLKNSSLTNTPLITVFTYQYALPFPMLFFNFQERLTRIVDALINQPLSQLPGRLVFDPRLHLETSESAEDYDLDSLY